MTPRQAKKALDALDNLREDVSTFARWAKHKYQPTQWEDEALARLRWYLIHLAESGD